MGRNLQSIVYKRLFLYQYCSVKNIESNTVGTCFSNGGYIESNKKEIQFGEIIGSETLYPYEISSGLYYHVQPYFSKYLSEA